MTNSTVPLYPIQTVISTFIYNSTPSLQSRRAADPRYRVPTVGDRGAIHQRGGRQLRRLQEGDPRRARRGGQQPLAHRQRRSPTVIDE